MKQGIVKFSKEFKTMTGNIWLGIENEYDMKTEDPIDVFKRAEETIQQYAKVSGLVIYFDPHAGTLPPGPPTEMPVINKADERLGILIENATTHDQLLAYKNDITTPYLADLYSTKLKLLSSQLYGK